MKTKVLGTAVLIAALAVLFSVQVALAHETINVGDYEVEIGWLSEPPLVGQQNAIAFNVSNPAAPDEEVDVSALVVEVSYGGETRTLDLQPLGEDTPNQYVAPLLPTRPGTYTVLLTGKLGTADADASVEPEEVEAADVLAFPSQPAAGSSGDMLSWVALIAGLGGLILGFLAFQKSK